MQMAFVLAPIIWQKVNALNYDVLLILGLLLMFRLLQHHEVDWDLFLPLNNLVSVNVIFNFIRRNAVLSFMV